MYRKVTSLYLTRHGKTEWNTLFKMQGVCNSPLTSEGIEGAVKLGETLNSLPEFPVCCYVSPMQRAQDTANLALNGHDIPVYVEPLINEMNLGIFEGMTRADARDKYPEVFNDFRYRPAFYEPIDGGETFYELYDRAAEFLKKIITGPDTNGPILVVSHQILMQAFICILEGKTVDKLRDINEVGQTTLYHVNIEPGDFSNKYRATFVMRDGVLLSEEEQQNFISEFML